MANTNEQLTRRQAQLGFQSNDWGERSGDGDDSSEIDPMDEDEMQFFFQEMEKLAQKTGIGLQFFQQLYLDQRGAPMHIDNFWDASTLIWAFLGEGRDVSSLSSKNFFRDGKFRLPEEIEMSQEKKKQKAKSEHARQV